MGTDSGTSRLNGEEDVNNNLGKTSGQPVEKKGVVHRHEKSGESYPKPRTTNPHLTHIGLHQKHT